MSEHREWHYELVKFTPFAALEKEHNAAVRAYRDAMAECERLGKANDEACDRISGLEGASEKDWAEWNFERGSGPTPPTVKESLIVGEDSSAVQSFSAAEYAALAAGGLEPCAMPERPEAMLNPAPDAKCAMCAEWERDCRALSAASRSIDARIAARARGEGNGL